MAGQSNMVEAALEARKRAKFISRRASPKRDENAIRERRAELRAVAKRRIAALEADALTKIKMFCHDAHSRVLAHGLASASAIALFDALTSAEEMMPLLAMLSIEEILQTRKAALEAQRAGLPHLALARDWGVDC